MHRFVGSLDGSICCRYGDESAPFPEGMKIAPYEIRGKRPHPGFASWTDAVNLPFPLDQLHAIALWLTSNSTNPVSIYERMTTLA